MSQQSPRLIRFNQLKTEKDIPWTRMTIDRHEKAGKFPRRVRLGEATIAWSEDEIDAWIAARIEDRAAQNAA